MGAWTDSGDGVRVAVPVSGMRMVFEKLYANQSAGDAAFSAAYATPSGSTASALLAMLGAVLVVGGGVVRLWRRPVEAPAVAAGAVVVGAALLVLTVGYLEVGVVGPIVAAVFAGLALLVQQVGDPLGAWLAAGAPLPAPAGGPAQTPPPPPSAPSTPGWDEDLLALEDDERPADDEGEDEPPA